MRILVIEDEKKMSDFLKRGLAEAGYAVDCAGTGNGAELLIAENPYDLLVLDVMLPDTNGFDLARQIRQNGFENPILFLTAMGSTRDKIKGLDSGGDVYLTKPFAFDELLAHVRALMRRKSSSQVSLLEFGGLRMDLIRREVKRDGQSITLTPKEFSLLEYFLRNPERPISRTELTEHVWDIHFDPGSNIVDVYIKTLRKKLDEISPKKLIHTVVGVGYALKLE
ncbi:MAG: response regulator transcription factor [Bdellovibrionia bacterium]